MSMNEKKSSEKSKTGKDYLKEFFKQGGMMLGVGLVVASMAGNINQTQNFIQYSPDANITPIAQVFAGSKAPIHVVTNHTEAMAALAASRALGGNLPENELADLNSLTQMSNPAAFAFGVENKTNTSDGNLITGCIIGGSNINIGYMSNMAKNGEGIENSYNVVPVDFLRRHITAHEAGHCMHMQHPSFTQDTSTSNPTVNIQRQEMVADFLAGAALGMTTPASERASVLDKLQSIQDTRNVSAFGSSNQEGSLTHHTKNANIAGFQAGIGRTPRSMGNIIEQARSFALTNAMSPDAADRIQNELKMAHQSVNNLMQTTNESSQSSLNPTGDINVEIQIQDSNRAHARFNLAQSLDLSPDVREIISGAKTAHESLMSANQTRGMGLSASLRGLESAFPDNPEIRTTLRAIGLESSTRGQDWTVRALEKTMNNTTNDSLRENLGALTTNIKIDNQIISQNLNLTPASVAPMARNIGFSR